MQLSRPTALSNILQELKKHLLEGREARERERDRDLLS